MFLPCYIFFTHFEFAAKFIYRLHFTGYFIRFFHVYETIKYWRGISCRAKIQLLFYYCFYFQILKAGGLPCYNLDRRTAAISHVFLSATTKEKKMYKSKKFEDLTISDDFMFGIVNRFWKLYWILRLHAVETKFCDLCLHLWSVPYRQACVYFWKPLRGRSESAS